MQRMLQDLVATLKAVGKSTELHETDDGSRVLILPYGGRILGFSRPAAKRISSGPIPYSTVRKLRAHTTRAMIGRTPAVTEPGSRRKSISSSRNIPTSILPPIGNHAASIQETMNW